MIKRIYRRKEDFMPLLIIGDEQVSMIKKYLGKCHLYAEFIGKKAISVCAVIKVDNTTLEVKNLAVLPSMQNKGFGKRILTYIENRYKRSYKTVILGTGDSKQTVSFYEKCGYKRYSVIKNFFTDNYDHPIYENGKQLVDMIYFKKEIDNED